MRKILKHYALGITLGLVVFMISYLAMLVPGIGYGVLLVIYTVTLLAQGAFYGLTAAHGRAWSTMSFVVNLVLWVTELVQLEHLLEGSSAHRFLYHDDDSYALIYVLGGFLWATNKLVLDKLIDVVIDQSKTHVQPLEK